jgi:predicted membrane metal-binding protein
MYQNSAAAAATGASGGVLAATGFAPLWIILASFALLAAGTAVLRIVPRRARKDPLAPPSRRRRGKGSGRWGPES